MGAFDDTNGAFFENSGNKISFCIKNDGKVLKLTSGNNGDYNIAVDSEFHTYEIDYLLRSAVFRQDGRTLHTFSFRRNEIMSIPDVPVRFEVSGSSSSVYGLNVLVGTISRVEDVEKAPIYMHIDTAETRVIKNRASGLIKVIVNKKGVGNSKMTLFDGSNIIAIIDLSEGVGDINYEFDTNGALSYTTEGSSFDVTLVYN